MAFVDLTVFRFLLTIVAILVHVCHVEVVPPTKTSAEKCRINNAAKPLAFLARSTDHIQRDGARPRVCPRDQIIHFHWPITWRKTSLDAPRISADLTSSFCLACQSVVVTRRHATRRSEPVAVQHGAINSGA